VYDLLRVELMSGAYPDNLLPGEDTLIRTYAVSRGVIRQVLLLLQEQGLVERVRGAGTFVMAPSVWLHGIDESRDLAQEVNAKGTRAVIRKVHVGTHPGTEFIGRLLEIGAHDDVVILETATSLDGYPLGVRTAFLPAARFGRLATDPDLDLDRSPYEIIADVLAEPVGETELFIAASTANRVVAEALGVGVGAALLDTTRIVRDRRGMPLEYSISHARADRLVFSSVMRVPGDELGGR
jgi:GntR family transcriptional regulator